MATKRVPFSFGADSFRDLRLLADGRISINPSASGAKRFRRERRRPE